MGDNFYEVAVLWIAVSRVGSDAAYVAGAETVSSLAFALIGGSLADQWNRRFAMVGADVARAAAVIALPIIAATGTLEIWHMAVVAALVGALGSLFDPALQASLPDLAGDAESLRAVNALMDATRRVARVVAPSLAGAVALVLPITHFFTVDAVSFGVSALALISLGRSAARWEPRADGPREGFLAGIATAARLVREHGELAWAYASLIVANFSWALFLVGVPLLVARDLGGAVGNYGLVMGAYGAGNVASNLVMASAVVTRRMRVLHAGQMAFGLGLALISWAPGVPVAILGAAFSAIGGPMGDVTILTMMQTEVPRDHFGKVYALRVALAAGGVLAGSLAASPIMHAVGARGGLLVAGVLSVITGLAGMVRFFRA